MPLLNVPQGKTQPETPKSPNLKIEVLLGNPVSDPIRTELVSVQQLFSHVTTKPNWSKVLCPAYQISGECF